MPPRVVVLGGGSTGEAFAAALRSHDEAAEITIVERELLGGECTFWACMPSKTLLRTPELVASARRAPGAAEAVTGDPDVERIFWWRDQVIDNLEEISRLNQLCVERGVRQAVLLRVGPGVEAHTHAHILTGALDTKFGLSIDTGAARDAVALLRGSDGLELVGLHAHIGSQIFELEPYVSAIEALAGLTGPDWECRILNVGGGGEPTSVNRLLEIVAGLTGATPDPNRRRT